MYITGLTQSIPLCPWDLLHNLHSIVEREIAWASVLNLRELQNGNNRGFLQINSCKHKAGVTAMEVSDVVIPCTL